MHQVPVLACFALAPDAGFHPHANLRHYSFLFDGLVELSLSLAQQRSVRLVVALADPVELVTQLGSCAKEIVVDVGYLRVQKKWCADVAQRADCLLTQVETNVVVPVELASDKSEFAARTIRRKIWAHAARMLRVIGSVGIDNPSLDVVLPVLSKNVEIIHCHARKDIPALLDRLKVDASVPPISDMRGGHSEARKKLEEFCNSRLSNYDTQRNNPGKDFQSNMSAYLHFGHISPIEIVCAINAAPVKKAAKEAYIEELLVRRELSMNFVHFEPDNYDSLACLPDWARITLEQHAKDKRDYVYTEAQLERGETHDPYWNAAQLEMVHCGKMHGYMRMYWGKKVMEWTESMEHAYAILMKFNDRYELDGRDPNGYEGVAWCFGKHDRAHAERRVTGKLRWMSDAGLERKYKEGLREYVVRSYGLAGREPPHMTAGKSAAKKSKR